MIRVATTGVLTLFSIVTSAQQITPPPSEFEAVSIKSGDQNGRGQFLQPPGGDFRARAVTLKLLIEQASDVRDYQISGGPDWVGTQRYDIVAKAERTPTDTSAIQPNNAELTRTRIQALLADRFQLKLHRETKEGLCTRSWWLRTGRS